MTPPRHCAEQGDYATDALGTPTAFHLTTEQTHEMENADALLRETPTANVIADRAYVARERVKCSQRR